jgi:hypothetical protein
VKTRRILRIASPLVIATPLFLAGGIATEIYVVLETVIENRMWSSVGRLRRFFIFALCWYALPLGLKYSGQAGKGGTDAMVG